MSLRNRYALTPLILILFLMTVAQNAFTQSPKDLYTKIEYMIPMRDGTRLYTSVYVPKNRPGQHPILMERTPYGAGPYGPTAFRGNRGSKKFVENGYIFAYQDVRGMGRSEGRYNNDRPQMLTPLRPHDIDESTDTYDAIEYLVKNVPENNGRVGLWGISYPGFYAGVGAINSHPALKAASPQAPVSDWFIGDDFHHQGAFFLIDATRFARFGQSPPKPGTIIRSMNPGSDFYKFFLEKGYPSVLTDEYYKDTDGLWKYLMEHGTYDEYWQARNLPQQMKNVKCAVLTVGGWFDAEDCWGAIHTYKGTEAQNKGIFNAIVMGPWYHGMWAAPVGNKFGDMDFGQPTSTYYQEEIEFPFFDACLRGNGKPRMPEAQMFETGTNKWRTFPQWPPRNAKETALYLLPGKGVGMEPPTATPNGEFEEYVSDPANPVPYQGGTIRTRTREYMVDDQRFASSRSDVVTYQTPPLKSDMTIAGPIQADLFFSTTGTDADMVVKVIDVYPDDAPGKLAGYQMLLRAEIMRTKFRMSYANPSPLTPGKVESVSYELPDVLHTFQKGHRLMVQIQSSWFPLVDRNPQRLMDIYTAKPEEYQKATHRIYHTPSYPSRLRVGVIKG